MERAKKQHGAELEGTDSFGAEFWILQETSRVRWSFILLDPVWICQISNAEATLKEDRPR